MIMKIQQYFIFSLLLVGLVFNSCQEDNILYEYPYEAEVIRRNIDCGFYEIKITKGLERMKVVYGEINVGDIFIAKNLPSEFEVNGLKIKLDLRKPKSNELGACTHLGPSYPWIFVTKAEK